MEPIKEMTICDRCSAEMPLEVASTPTKGQWKGATLCPGCYAEIQDETVTRPPVQPTDAK